MNVSNFAFLSHVWQGLLDASEVAVANHYRAPWELVEARAPVSRPLASTGLANGIARTACRA